MRHDSFRCESTHVSVDSRVTPREVLEIEVRRRRVRMRGRHAALTPRARATETGLGLEPSILPDREGPTALQAAGDACHLFRPEAQERVILRCRPEPGKLDVAASQYCAGSGSSLFSAVGGSRTGRRWSITDEHMRMNSGPAPEQPQEFRKDGEHSTSRLASGSLPHVRRSHVGRPDRVSGSPRIDNMRINVEQTHVQDLLRRAIHAR